MGKQNKTLAEDKRQYNLTLSDAQVAAIKQGANQAGMDEADWVRNVLEEAIPNFPKFVDKKPFEQKSVFALTSNHYAIMTTKPDGVRVTIHKRDDSNPQKSVNYPISDILYNNPKANNYQLAVQYIVGTATGLVEKDT